MGEPWRLTVSEGLQRIGEGTLTAADWVRSLLARIGQCEEKVEAWVQVDDEGALRAAGEADEARAQGRPLGPLAGAPFAAKDIFDVKGLLREAGTPLYRGHVAAEDATCVARLREAGAIPLGKAVTTQFATADPSITHNPWDLARTPGGSSSGSAAAVACGMIPFALGSQTTGSTLRPAAFCGAAALKPTYGRIPRDGIIKVSYSFDHVGLIARSAADLARMLVAMAGPGERDDATPDVPIPDLRVALAPRRPGRVVFFKGLLSHASGEVAEWTLRAAAALQEKGIRVEEGELPLTMDVIHAAHFIARCVDAAAYHEEMFIENADTYAPLIRKSLTTGLMVPAVHYLKALRLRGRYVREMDRLMEKYDLVLLPAFSERPPLREVSTGDPAFSEPLSLAGQPAVSLPLGRGEGNLPIGIQLGSSRFGEERLLAASRWCEEELGWRCEIAEP